MRVSWDAAKNLANLRKHAVSFREAQELFLAGGEYLEIYDESHSELEDRFIAIGPISRGLVVVIWTDRDEETIRLISARWATRRERDLFHSTREPNP